MVWLLFALIYKYFPDVKIAWGDVLIGLYLGQVAVGSTYGAADSFVVLLIWNYYSALICFCGAELTQVYARRFGNEIRLQSHAARAAQ
jgi:membrane protein